MLDAELVIMRHCDELTVAHLEQLLVTFENQAQEVTVYCRCRRDVELNYIHKVRLQREYVRCSLMYVMRSALDENL